MELHAIPYGSEPPIAATFELSENSRLGLTIKNVALHPRFEACNSNTLLGLPQACFKIASGNTVVLNNPLSFTDPSGQDGGLVLCAGGPVACAAGVAVTAIFDWKFFESLFGGPSFHGSLKPRPNAQPWDEHNIMYGPNIAGALGLPDAGCDFGACGDISSGFQQPGQANQNDNGPSYPYIPPWLAQNRNQQGRPPGRQTPRNIPTENPGAEPQLGPTNEPPPTNSGRFWYTLMQLLRIMDNNINPPMIPVIVPPCTVDPIQPYCHRPYNPND